MSAVNDNHREVHAITFDSRDYKEGKETPREYVDALRVLARKYFAVGEQDARVQDRFIRGMPNRLKKKLLTQGPDPTVDDLVDFLNMKLAIDKACPSGEHVNAFSDLNVAIQTQMTNALMELNKTRDEMKNAQHNLVAQLVPRTQQNSSPSTPNSPRGNGRTTTFTLLPFKAQFRLFRKLEPHLLPASLPLVTLAVW